MAGFIRRYNFFPDATTIQAIEGVIIVDAAPSGAVQGADSGTVAYVGEYEDGGFATDPVVPTDLFHPRGGPIAVGRDRWASLVGTLGYNWNNQKYQWPCARLAGGEFWNGNAYIQAKGLAFRRFYAVRVDTSIGSLVFSPLAFLESSVVGPWALATGQTLVGSVNGAGNITSTFTGAPAAITGAAAAFGSIVAGEQVTIAIDGQASVTTTFQTGDTTIAAVIARINGTFGSLIASNTAGQLTITSPTGGTASSVNVISATTGTLAHLGISSGLTSGTGNVANIASVKATEVQTIVQAALTGSTVRLPASGKVRICSATGGTGTIQIVSGTAAAAFGFTTGVTVSASSGASATSIPAGTVCNAGGAAATRVVTMQTLQIPASTTVAVTVKCRPAQDDGTYTGSAALTINTIETLPSLISEWVVSNPVLLTAALTEAQKDAAYQAAIDTTRAMSGPARKFNYIASARQSSRLRPYLQQNAIQTSGIGHFGRKAFVCPPLGTSLATMQGAGDPGVAATADERTIYSPGWRKYIAEIAVLGPALGGTGFTIDGIVQTHGDVVLASLCSLLNPEENPAQATQFIDNSLYLGVENALTSWGEPEYELAKAAGICAPFYDDDEGPQYMSGVTSVSPTSFPSKVPIARVKLADFLSDTMAGFQKSYIKKLGTQALKDLLLTKLEELLGGLKDSQRIGNYSTSVGTPPARRVYVLNWAVDPLDSMDSIIDNMIVGEGALGGVPKAA